MWVMTHIGGPKWSHFQARNTPFPTLGIPCYRWMYTISHTPLRGYRGDMGYSTPYRVFSKGVK